MSPALGTVHRPAATAAAPVLLSVVMACLALMTGNAWFLVLGGATTGAGLAAVAHRARLDGLVLTVEQPARLSVGDDVPARVTAVNAGSRRSSEATIVLHTLGLGDLVLGLGALEPGERVSVDVVRTAVRRAVAPGTWAEATARPGLGLVTARRSLPLDGPVTVHPRLSAAPVVPQTFGPARAGVGPLTPGSGVEVLGVREWRAGDDRSRVHWRSTARTGRPTLLERGDPRTVELRLVLVGSDTEPGFEEALAAAASVSDASLWAGGTVTVVAWHATGPVLAPQSDAGALLDWWAAVNGTVLPDPGDFGAVVLDGFGVGELLVAAPDGLPPEWFAQAAVSCPGLVLRRLEVSP